MKKIILIYPSAMTERCMREGGAGGAGAAEWGEGGGEKENE